MILQSLCEYYQRKGKDLPAYGFQVREIPFLIVLKSSGEFLELQDTREMNPQTKRRQSKSFCIPKERQRTGGDAWKVTNLLWDHVGFVLGYPSTTATKDMQKSQKQLGTFRKMVADLSATYPQDVDLCAVQAFYEQEHYKAVFSDSKWPLCAKIKGCNLSFKIAGREGLITDNSNVRAIAEAFYEQEKSDDNVEQNEPALNGLCLVSGDKAAIARTHPRVLVNRKRPNTKLVSFQKNSGFDSYGKDQGINSPISKRAAFQYSTAMNHLLDSSQRIEVGDAATVFWASRQDPMESLLSQLFSEPPADDPHQGTNAVKFLFEAPLAGTSAIDESNSTRFYVFGVTTPNDARVAVRFWHVALVRELAGHIRQHFEDLKVIRPQYVSSPFLSLKALLIATSPLADLEKLPPNLAGDFMKAILDGAAYPQTLLPAVLRRIHAEQAMKDKKTGKHKEHVTYARAALIKACLNRQIRMFNPTQETEITMSFDDSNTNIGYRLGSLFAVLEKIQEDVSPGLNTTIRDSYFGSASSTPAAVLPTLMRRSQNHMTKLRKEKPGLYVIRDKQIQAIHSDGVDGKIGYPSVLSLPDQGRFVIGYYQQRQEFFKP
jgi:CRISPR-associated protein Csd1